MFCASVTAGDGLHTSIPGAALARLWLILALAVAPDVTQAAGESVATDGFQSFVEDLWPQVQSRGVSRAMFEAAFAGLVPDPLVLAATRRQPD